jgi:hypothetical protein
MRDKRRELLGRVPNGVGDVYPQATYTECQERHFGRNVHHVNDGNLQQ